LLVAPIHELASEGSTNYPPGLFDGPADLSPMHMLPCVPHYA
jgi:hypothetical protein